jgi:Na+-transporting NADH:ubiquinone oxidoreductase subunit NqrB
MATLVGMALGGWMPGWIFDLTGSYRAAFVNGIAWSLVTAGIALFLLFRARPGWGLPATPVVRSESRHPS